MRTLFALLCLTGSAAAVDWHTLTIKGQTIVAASDDAVRLSTDRGRRFKTVEFDGVRAVAARPKGAFVAAFQGLWWVTSRGAKAVSVPATVQTVRGVWAGRGWLMVAADSPSPGLAWETDESDHNVAVWVRRGGRWRQLFKHIPSDAKNALTTLRIGPKGHAMASVIHTAGCGGVAVGPGEIWDPNGPTKQLPERSNAWELPIGIHRDWILAYCPEDNGHCVYDPLRSALPLPQGRPDTPTSFQISPDARWVAVSDSDDPDVDNLRVYERGANGWAGYREYNGQIIGARNDGITIRSATRVLHVGTKVETLGTLPRDVMVDMDTRGRVYALIDDELVMLKGGKQVAIPGF